VKFIKNKWFVQGLGIIAFSILIWFFGALLAFGSFVPLESDTARFIIIVIILIVWVTANLLLQLKANRANAQMIDDLAKNDPDEDLVNQEIATLNKNFDKALDVLKQSKNKQSKSNHYLYELPWYIIIGPPGAGKTTAFANSGLEFPLADKFGKNAVRGVGGTRNCDWWFTNEAVLLDTAGRYTTQDSNEKSDKKAWLTFLDLLKKHRPRQPINGVLVAMSLSDLLNQTQAERLANAKSIKERIGELYSHFGVHFPIYMVFTKSDLIAGFDEFFATLTKEERMQVWGFTFPQQIEAENIIEKVETHFDELLARLNSKLLQRLQEERDLQRRNLILGFPQRVELLKENMLSFLHECYGSNRYQTEIHLRGVYFTSGTQEGSPIDRLMSIFANAFKLELTRSSAFSGKGKSYFITRLLKDVVFEESQLVGSNQKLEKLNSLFRLSAYAGTFLASVLLLIFWTVSYSKNQAALTHTLEKIERYKQTIANNPINKPDFALLLEHLNAAQEMTSIYKDHSWLMTFGLYQGDKINPVITTVYEQVLQKEFLSLIKFKLEQRMSSVDALNSPEILYELLRAYLMLGEPKRLEPGLLKFWLAADLEKNIDADKQAQLLTHLDNLLTFSIEPQILNGHLIAANRQILNRIPVEQQIYMRVKSEALQDKTNDFQLQTALAPNGIHVFATLKETFAQQTIPYLFTHDGFYQLFLKKQKQLVEKSVSQNWVLGDSAKTTHVDANQLEQAILGLYYKDFIQYWDALLANLKVKPSSGIKESVEILEFLSSPDSPLKQLLLTLERETSLTRTPETTLDKIKQDAEKVVDERLKKLVGNAINQQPLGLEVEQHFQNLTVLVKAGVNGAAIPLDSTLATLGQLYGYMIDLQNATGTGALPPNPTAVVNKVKMESARLPEPIKTMAQDLTAGNVGVVLENSKSQLNKLWQSDVKPLYKSAITGRYPFSKNSKTEVTLQDFTRFFAQNGVLDQFFNTNLKSFVNTSGVNWTLINQDNKSIGISPSLLVEFQRADKMKQLFFQMGGQNLLVKFNLKPISLPDNVTKFWLNLEGQQIEAKKDAMKNVLLQWPGIDGSRAVRFGFETTDGKQITKEEDGAWAWFRLLDKSPIQKTDHGSYLITFTAEGLNAQFELIPNSVDNPFTNKEFQRLNLPASL
jgi:type VI secretion system protein ImpL